MSKKKEPIDVSEKVLAKFKELFRSARREHVRTQNSKATEGVATQAAFTFAKDHDLEWATRLIHISRQLYSAYNEDAAKELEMLSVPASFEGIKLHLIGKSYFNRKEYDEMIRCFNQALNSPGYDTPGEALTNIGVAFYSKGEYDEAIRYYKQALATPGYDSPGDALSNLGVAYDSKGEYDEAIRYYKQALATPGYDSPGNALNNLGIAYDIKGEHDEAIRSYKQALETPGYNTPGSALNNLGLSLLNKREYEEAIRYFEQALETPGYESPHTAQVNIAAALVDKGHLSEAKSILESVLKEPNSENQHWRAESVLRIVKQKLDQIKPSPEEIALSQKPDRNDPFALNMLKELSGKTTQYDQYVKEYKAKGHDKKTDELLILRGWSSSVTLLEGATNRHWYGGGYFLRWRGKGLIIDPGFDFIDNFHEAGCHLLEVSAVAVSHDHTDHNGDLRSLDDFIYELSRSPEIKAAGIAFKPVIIVDEDTSRRISDGTKDHRGPIRLFTDGDRVDESWYGGKRNNLPFEIQHFPVFHGNDVPRAQGFKILLLDEEGRTVLTIGYTGDTGYSEDLLEYLKDVDVLIAHVSQPDPLELQDPSHFKKVHLGYNGVTELVKHLKPKLTLVGEFWAGLVDLRMDIIAGVRRRTGVKTVLPATLGLKLSLPDLSITCTSTGRQTPYDQVRIVPPTEPFGDLGYVHPDRLI
jgi:Tfp pilus assembly protein PilF/ribonuclease BN (tRNA processing enzyme)